MHSSSARALSARDRDCSVCHVLVSLYSIPHFKFCNLIQSRDASLCECVASRPALKSSPIGERARSFWSFEPDTSSSQCPVLVLSPRAVWLVQSASPPSLDATRSHYVADLNLSYHFVPNGDRHTGRTKMPTESERALSTTRKRRGVVRASITRLDSRVTELESKEELTAADRLAAQHLLQKLNSLEAEFRSYHLAVVDLEGEQAILDKHDDSFSSSCLCTTACINCDPSCCSPFCNYNWCQVAQD